MHTHTDTHTYTVIVRHKDTTNKYTTKNKQIHNKE